LTLKHDALKNQLDKYQYRIAEILEKDVKGKSFGWWNLISKKVRKKRVWWFEEYYLKKKKKVVLIMAQKNMVFGTDLIFVLL
jgi:hypothetical protein